jgi:hypothetical protein
MTLDDEVAELRESIGRRLGGAAEVEASTLAGSMWQIEVLPINAKAASVTIIASKVEVILEAGRAFRAELRELARSREQIHEILAAIASGQLHERIRAGRGTFELRLNTGERIKGSQNGIRSNSRRAEVVDYEPYAPE